LLIAALAVSGCSSFGGTKRPQAEATVNPNVYPSNYREQIVGVLNMQLNNPVDFRTALISQPMLKPLADSSLPHYVVCLQFPNRSDHQIKVVIFLEAAPTQYIDATPQLCGDAAYQPFPELAKMTPAK